MVASTLEPNASEVELLVEFDFDPGAVVVLDLPLVPWLFTWAQQVFGLALRPDSHYVVLSSDFGAVN